MMELFLLFRTGIEHTWSFGGTVFLFAHDRFVADNWECRWNGHG